MYHDQRKVFEAIPPESVKRILLALFAYSETGETPTLDAMETAILEPLKAAVDRGAGSYEAICERNRQNALKRWRGDDTTQCDAMPPHTTQCDAMPDMPTGTGTGTNISSPLIPLKRNSPPEGNMQTDAGKKKRFVPPTLEQVQAYCRERGNNVNASSFIDHYTAVGWKVGKAPMKDWQAAVRNWERRDREKESLEATPSPSPRPKKVTMEDFDFVH